MDRVVRLIEKQIEAAGETLARGFFNDPLTVYMIPDGHERARLLPNHFTPVASLVAVLPFSRGDPATAAYSPAA